jgi:hypothetical protein
MITAHLPAGYLLARALPPRPGLVATVLAASVLPDLDLAWFYLVDDRAFHHHRYWVHVPGFWALVAVVVLPPLRLFAPRLFPYAVAALAAILLHLVLDSVAGSIMWLWPFSDRLHALVEVPATRSHWVLSFLTHWTVLLELAIWAAAAAVLLGGRRPGPA